MNAINANQEGLNIISMQEFLHMEKFAVKLNEAGCTPDDCADLYLHLESIGSRPHWNTDPPECALFIPSGDGFTVKENSTDGPICTYNATDSGEVLHLSTRILSPFYSFVLFENEFQGRFAKRLIRDFLHYKEEIICASARIVNAIEESALTIRASNHEFYSMHIRRGDFARQYPEGDVSAEDLIMQIEADGILAENSLVYIATDEHDKSFFHPFQEKYHVLFLQDFPAQIEGIGDEYYPMLDQLVASKSAMFYGTWPSTFSSYINRLRGYYSIKDSTAKTDGHIDSFYFSPDHKYAMMEYKATEEPSLSWMREYPEAWHLIDENDNDLGIMK